MIASVRGELIHKDTMRVVVECGGVGYGLAMSLSGLARLGAVGENVRLFVYTHVAQDALRLYGFVDDDERRAFEILIGTSGVGPKLALAVLSTLSPDELADVVQREDIKTLVRIPGVGKKTAERLLIELRDRLPRGMVHQNTPVPMIAGQAAMMQDLVSALVHLDFAPAVAEEAARHARTLLPKETDIATLVREALRSTTRRDEKRRSHG